MSEVSPNFGYQPPDKWSIGDRPSRHGYRDRFNALWRWGVRAPRPELHPFAGHWDVQLDNANAINGWRQLLEQSYGRRVSFNDTHINVEPNGTIVDFSFDRS